MKSQNKNPWKIEKSTHKQELTKKLVAGAAGVAALIGSGAVGASLGSNGQSREIASMEQKIDSLGNSEKAVAQEAVLNYQFAIEQAANYTKALNENPKAIIPALIFNGNFVPVLPNTEQSKGGEQPRILDPIVLSTSSTNPLESGYIGVQSVSPDGSFEIAVLPTSEYNFIPNKGSKEEVISVYLTGQGGKGVPGYIENLDLVAYTTSNHSQLLQPDGAAVSPGIVEEMEK